MKNKLTDLNDHLFAQLERLSSEDMSPEQIAAETQRATATFRAFVHEFERASGIA